MAGRAPACMGGRHGTASSPRLSTTPSRAPHDLSPPRCQPCQDRAPWLAVVSPASSVVPAQSQCVFNVG